MRNRCSSSSIPILSSRYIPEGLYPTSSTHLAVLTSMQSGTPPFPKPHVHKSRGKPLFRCLGDTPDVQKQTSRFPATQDRTASRWDSGHRSRSRQRGSGQGREEVHGDHTRDTKFTNPERVGMEVESDSCISCIV